MIVRWEQGRETVDGLLAGGRLMRVTPNRHLAAVMLDQAADHLASADQIVSTDSVQLEVVLAQLDPPLGATFSPFSWMRPLRNHTEYPAPEHPTAQASTR